MDRKVSNHGWKKDGGRVMKSGKRNWGGGASTVLVKCAQNTKYTSPIKGT